MAAATTRQAAHAAIAMALLIPRFAIPAIVKNPDNTGRLLRQPLHWITKLSGLPFLDREGRILLIVVHLAANGPRKMNPCRPVAGLMAVRGLALGNGGMPIRNPLAHAGSGAECSAFHACRLRKIVSEVSSL
jgi:hypothetical protein